MMYYNDIFKGYNNDGQYLPVGTIMKWNEQTDVPNESSSASNFEYLKMAS